MAIPLPPVDELNRLDTADFAGALTKLFEHGPLLFERLARRRPFRSYVELLAAARETAFALSASEQTTLLASHPRIGAARATLSEASAREQGEGTTADVERDLARLNDEYERRLGFRFVVFVDRRSKAEIREVLRRRLENPRSVELRAGIEAILAIAADRAGVPWT